MKKSLLFCTIISASAITGGAFAADCTSVSDSVTETRCKNLGYTMTASQCSGKNMVKCPLNTNWVWCGDGSVAQTTPTPSCTYTYTNTSVADKNGGSCMNGSTTYYEKACSGTKQSACDTSTSTFTTTCTAVDGTKYGTCTCKYTITNTATADSSGKSCTKGSTTYYEKNCTGTKQSACDTSTNTFTTTCTTVSGDKYGTCTAIPLDTCLGYTLTTCPLNGECESCGGKYKLTCCKAGQGNYYDSNANACTTERLGAMIITCIDVGDRLPVLPDIGGGGGGLEGIIDSEIMDGNCNDPTYYPEHQFVCDKLFCDPTSEYYRSDWTCTK